MSELLECAEPCGRIIIVDSDIEARATIAAYLSCHGFAAESVAGVKDLNDASATAAADLVLLDVSFPGAGALHLCRSLTEIGRPVILMSKTANATDRIIGLELGADDYLKTPCNPREVLARVRAVLRGRQRGLNVINFDPQFEFAHWRIWPIKRCLKRPDGSDVKLSEGEFRFLNVFVDHPRRVVTRAQMIRLAGMDHLTTDERAVDVQVSRLRRKLGGGGVDFIHTSRSVGYVFLPDVYRIA